MKIYRKQRDSRFIIYQSLYIFAIAVLIFKGTDLSLDEVSPTRKSIVQLDVSEIVVDTTKNKVIRWDKSKDTIIQIASKEDTVIKKRDVGKPTIKYVGNDWKEKKEDETAKTEEKKNPEGDISKPGTEQKVPGDGK